MSREPTLWMWTPPWNTEIRPATRRDLLAGLGLLCPTCHGTGECQASSHKLYSNGPDHNHPCSGCGGHGYNPEVVERVGHLLVEYGHEFADGGRTARHKEWAVTVLDTLQEEPE